MNNALRRGFDLFAWCAFVIIGALQMAKVRAGFVTNYGADIVCPALLYVLIRRNRTVLKLLWRSHPTPEFAALILLVACFAWEWSQRYRFEGTVLDIARGRFDPLDLLAYAGAIGAVYAADRLTDGVHATNGRHSRLSAALASIFEIDPQTRRATR